MKSWLRRSPARSSMTGRERSRKMRVLAQHHRQFDVSLATAGIGWRFSPRSHAGIADAITSRSLGARPLSPWDSGRIRKTWHFRRFADTYPFALPATVGGGTAETVPQLR